MKILIKGYKKQQLNLVLDKRLRQSINRLQPREEVHKPRAFIMMEILKWPL